MSNPFEEMKLMLENLQHSVNRLEEAKEKPQNDIIPLDEFCHIYGVKRQTVYNRINDPKSVMPYLKQGGKIYFSRKAVNAWIRKGEPKKKKEVSSC